MLRKVIAAAVVASTLACGVAHAGDRTGALLGGIAVGAVGGAIIGSALSQAHPAPVYAVAPPPPPPQPVYVQAPPRDPFWSPMARLHDECDMGNRGACIRFGIMIGKHQERVAEWRRTYPTYFTY